MLLTAGTFTLTVLIYLSELVPLFNSRKPGRTCIVTHPNPQNIPVQSNEVCLPIRATDSCCLDKVKRDHKGVFAILSPGVLI